MQNLGNTCFANSVLQCLAHTNYIFAYCAQSFHSKHCHSRISHTVENEFEKTHEISKMEKNDNILKEESRYV